MTDPVQSPADDPETDTEDRLEQLAPSTGGSVEQALESDEAFAGPDAELRAEDERLADDARDTGE